MKIVNLGSGSKGNCTLIKTGDTNILIDAGLPITEIETKLLFLGVEPGDVDGILITHEHSDHIKSVERLSKKYHIPVFAHMQEWPCLSKKNASVATTAKNV